MTPATPSRLLIAAALLASLAWLPSLRAQTVPAANPPIPAPIETLHIPIETDPNEGQAPVGRFLTMALVVDDKTVPAAKQDLTSRKLFVDNALMLKQYDALRADPAYRFLDIANSRASGDDAVVLTTNPSTPTGKPMLFRLHKKEGTWLITSAEFLPRDEARNQLETFIRKTSPAAATTSAPEVAAEPALDPLVADLLVPDRRNDAGRKLLAKWDAAHAENVDKLGVTPIRNVIVCPQPLGSPLFLVFFTGRANATTDRSTGPAALVDSQGNLKRWEYHTPDETLVDITNDGVLDRIGSYLTSLSSDEGHDVNVLTIVPHTLEYAPSLRVAYNPVIRGTEPKPRAWSWELRSTESRNIQTIVIGPRDPKTHLITPIASYTWDPKTKTYLGPAGSPDEKFIRLTEEGDKQALPLVGLDPNTPSEIRNHK